MFKKLKSMFGGGAAEEKKPQQEEQAIEQQQQDSDVASPGEQTEAEVVAPDVEQTAVSHVEPETEVVEASFDDNEPQTSAPAPTDNDVVVIDEPATANVQDIPPTAVEEDAESTQPDENVVSEQADSVVISDAMAADNNVEIALETNAETVIETAPAAPVEEKKGFFARIKSGLSKTKANLTEQLGNLFLGAKEIDEDLLEEIETLLLMADVGVEATTEIIQRLTDKVERKQLGDAQALQEALKEELAGLLHRSEEPLNIECDNKPYVILMVGVNGVGKTTTIGKLAKRFQSEGKSVMLAAGDTFRAAAVEQLQVWGERNNVPVIAQHTGADSASVIYDAVQSAQAKGVDVLIADTAGRLQNKDNLMQELEKVVRVTKKLSPDAPHEVMLVLDAGTGQNALSQAKIFKESVGVTGISLTKLDGTAKGGVIFAIAKQMDLPIRFIGVGEQIDDLRPFKSQEFVDALFD